MAHHRKHWIILLIVFLDTFSEQPFSSATHERMIIKYKIQSQYF